MSATFVSASTQYLSSTTLPFTVTPFTIGMWVKPTTTAVVKALWTLDAGGISGVNYWALLQWNTDQFNAQVNFGLDRDCLAGTVTSGSWCYLVARYITSSNRRLAVLNANGTTSHNQNTSIATPAGTISGEGIGGDSVGTNLFDGNVAEFWKTNTDIQADGLQLQDSTLRQLAYQGPFSLPHIAKDIIEYRSLREDPTKDKIQEVWYGRKGIITWVNNNSVGTGDHSPLAHGYIKPAQDQTLLIV